MTSQRFGVLGALARRLEENRVSVSAVLCHARQAQDTFEQTRPRAHLAPLTLKTQ